MTKKINLVYDTTCMAPHLVNGTGTGIYTVAFEILKELCHRKRFNIQLYCSESLKSKLKKGLKNAPKEIKKLKLFNITKLNEIDVFFSPMFTFPKEIANQSNIQKYLFLYDTIPHFYPKYWENKGNDWYFDMFNKLSKDDFYFTDSLSTQNDFIKYNQNVTHSNSAVALLACDNMFKPSFEKREQVLKKYHLPTNKKYVFSLCTLEPRKNLIRAVKTFIEFIKKNKIDNMVFILGGGHWTGFMNQLQKELEGLGTYKDKILQAGYIDKADLATFYSGAEWFVYTSQYEGFGLPPLEAMACGIPVITSNNSSLPEVIGDAGIMIDWDSDEQHIAAYEKYYFDKKYRQKMAQKGYEHAKLFSWKKTVDVIEKKIKERFAQKEVLQNKNEKNGKLNLLIDGNILVNATKKNAARSGVFFVVYNLLRELNRQKKFNLFLYLKNENLKSVVDLLNQDENLKGLKVANLSNLKEIDAFLSPHADIPDFIVQEGHIRAYKITYDFMGCIFDDKIFSTRLENHQRAALTCQKQFCISESTKQDYLKFVPQISSDKLIVTHLGASDRFYKCKISEIEKVKNKLHLPDKYILSVCNLAPHKNLFTAIDAFVDFIKTKKIKNLSYVLCGSIPKWNEVVFEEKMKSLGKYRDKIILTGYVDDEDIPALYSGAEWFVFPSLYEGFGLPILEAMQCGIPVICSNTSSMPEIIGNCGLQVNPEKKDEFVEAFSQMYSSANFRKKCAINGMERAKTFSWKKMADLITKNILSDAEKNQEIYPIVLITDENYVKPTIVTITSILANKHQNSNYKIYVLGNSLSDKSKKILSGMPNVSVIPFEKQFEEFQGTHQHVSAAALLKFKIAQLFPQYDKVLYLDTDMIIQHDLSELFKLDLTGKYAAVVKDMQGMLNGNAHKKINLTDYFNSGMMLLNIAKMRQEKTGDALLDYKLHKDKGAFMDQDCLNAIFDEKVIYLSCKYNYMPANQRIYTTEQVASFYNLPEALIPKFDLYASIIHLTNKQKPWDYTDVYGSDLWAKYYYISPLKNERLKYKGKKFSFPSLKKWGKNRKEKGSYRTIYRIGRIKFEKYKNYLNKTILFSKLKKIDFKMAGFSHAESWGMWSEGPYSELVFNLKRAKDNIVFHFDVKPFISSKHLRQKVTVYANNTTRVCEWLFELGKPFPKTDFVVDPKVKRPNGKLALRFLYENAISPKFLGIGTDTRKLALGFKSMQISCNKIKENRLIYSITRKPHIKKINFLGFIARYKRKKINSQNYKIKFSFLGFPIYVRKRKGYQKTIRILGIPFSTYLHHEETMDFMRKNFMTLRTEFDRRIQEEKLALRNTEKKLMDKFENDILVIQERVDSSQKEQRALLVSQDKKNHQRISLITKAFSNQKKELESQLKKDFQINKKKVEELKNNQEILSKEFEKSIKEQEKDFCRKEEKIYQRMDSMVSNKKMDAIQKGIDKQIQQLKTNNEVELQRTKKDFSVLSEGLDKTKEKVHSLTAEIETQKGKAESFFETVSEKTKIFDNFLKVDRVLNFSIEGNDSCLSYGFYSKEKWGVWLKPKASIVFRILNLQKDLELILSMKCFKPTNASKKFVTIFVNKKKFIKTSEERIVLKISKYLIASNGLVEIDFVTEGNESPKQLGMGPDDRLLGFGLISISSNTDIITASLDNQLMSYLFAEKSRALFKQEEWDSYLAKDTSQKQKLLEKNLDDESVELIRLFLDRKKAPFTFSAFENRQKELVMQNHPQYKIANTVGFQSEVFYFKNGLKFLEPDIIQKYLADRDVIDGGACSGDSALMFSEYPYIHQIYAFEPLKDRYEGLKETLEVNHCTKAQAVRAGISDQDGKEHILGETCTITTIDSFAKDKKIGCIKFDLEGMETKALKGSLETIKRDKPLLLICLYHTPTDFFEIKPMLENLNLGYKFMVKDTEPKNPGAGVHLMLIAY